MIMAVQGVIALVMQALVFPIMAERMGVYRLFIFVTVFHPIAYIIMPSLLFIPERLLYPAIYLYLTIRNFFGILVYPLLLILIKEATPSLTILGKVNGLAASASAACRMVAPPIAGYLYAMGRRMDCTALAWYGSTIVAILGAIQCFSVTRSKARERPIDLLKVEDVLAAEMGDSEAV
jgi:MFS family permease